MSLEFWIGLVLGAAFWATFGDALIAKVERWTDRT